MHASPLKSLLLECDQAIQALQKNEKLHLAEKEALLNTIKEKDALLANAGENINKQLRNRKMQDVDLYIRDIINMLKNNTTDTDLIVYRGIQDNVFNEVLKSLIEEASIFPDCDLYDKGILATSLVKGKELRGSRSPQKPNKFKGFRILVPKGSHVKYMGNVNFEEHYYEVDIQHGAKLQVISADKEYINCLLVSTN